MFGLLLVMYCDWAGSFSFAFAPAHVRQPLSLSSIISVANRRTLALSRPRSYRPAALSLSSACGRRRPHSTFSLGQETGCSPALPPLLDRSDGWNACPLPLRRPNRNRSVPEEQERSTICGRGEASFSTPTGRAPAAIVLPDLLYLQFRGWINAYDDAVMYLLINQYS
ncbi:hypothetical protein ACQJBY_063034 [Aegilops geniculata]